MTSQHALDCVKIIENGRLSRDIKIKLLSSILSENPTCVFDTVPLSCCTSVGGTAGNLLHAAVCSGDTNIVRLLISHGANVNLKNNFGCTPIFAACSMCVQDTICTSFKLVKFLLDNGADINVCDSKHQTPLFTAVEFRHSTDVIELLLCCGAKVNVKCLLRSLMFLNPKGAKLLIKELLLENPDLKKPYFLSQFKSSSKYWDELKIQINVELDLMKTKKLPNSTISIYDIFVADDRKLARYAQNEVLEELNSHEYKELFPVYIHKIKQQHQKGKERIKSENQASIVVDNFYPPLFDQCARQKIFEYLEMEDLKNLKEAGALKFLD